MRTNKMIVDQMQMGLPDIHARKNTKHQLIGHTSLTEQKSQVFGDAATRKWIGKHADMPDKLLQKKYIKVYRVSLTKPNDIDAVTETVPVAIDEDENLEPADGEIINDDSNNSDDSGVPEYLPEFFDENKGERESIGYDTAMLAQSGIANNAKSEEIHRIVSGILIINMVEVTALVAGFVVWLKRRRK